MDLRVRDNTGRRIIIEMQVVVTPAFRERLLYYGCRDYVNQLQEGDDYSALMPTLVICIVSSRLFLKDQSPDLHFQLTAHGCSEVFSDRLQFHTIELGKFAATGERLPTALDQWMFFLKNGDELDPRDLPPGMAAPEVRRAVEVLDMISQSERDRETYEVELKRRRDLVNRDALLRNEGREEGRQEGRQEGREQGRLIERIKILCQILGDPAPTDDDLAALSLEELSERAAECQRRARERGLPV